MQVGTLRLGGVCKHDTKMGVANANGGSLRLYPAFLNICKRRKTKTEQFWPFLGELESVAVTAEFYSSFGNYCPGLPLNPLTHLTDDTALPQNSKF